MKLASVILFSALTSSCIVAPAFSQTFEVLGLKSGMAMEEVAKSVRLEKLTLSTQSIENLIQLNAFYDKVFLTFTNDNRLYEAEIYVVKGSDYALKKARLNLISTKFQGIEVRDYTERTRGESTEYFVFTLRDKVIASEAALAHEKRILSSYRF